MKLKAKVKKPRVVWIAIPTRPRAGMHGLPCYWNKPTGFGDGWKVTRFVEAPKARRRKKKPKAEIVYGGNPRYNE